MAELLTGAQILRRTLVDAGVEVMFGYPGGAIMPLRRSGQGAVRPVAPRTAAAFAAADGYARASHRVGVCVRDSRVRNQPRDRGSRPRWTALGTGHYGTGRTADAGT